MTQLNTIFIRLLSLFLFSFSFFIEIVYAQDNDIDTKSITRFIESQMRISQIPGVAVSIVYHDSIIYAAGFGEANTAGDLITPQTPFYIGSNSKTLTALAVVQLIESGQIGLDTPVQKYLPQFRLKDAKASQVVTVRHLLNHTSGFPKSGGYDKRAQRTTHFDHIEFSHPPGQQPEYSSLNYLILGLLIEAVSGQPYEVYIQEHIFDPLDMQSTYINREKAAVDGLVQGCTYLYGLPIATSEPRYERSIIPAGFVISSAEDMAHYLSAYLNDGRYKGHSLLSSSSLRQMHQPWNDAEYGYGMAWGIGTWNELKAINHLGLTRTSSSIIVILPEQGYGITVLTNVNNGPFFSPTKDLMDGIIRRLVNQKIESYWPKELILRVAMGISVSFGLIGFAHRLWKWRKRSFPISIRRTSKIVGSLILDIILPIGAFIFIPKWVGVPVHTLITFMPDFGYALVIGCFSGPLNGILKAFVKSDS